MLDDAAGRRTVRHLLLAAFLPETGETASPDGAGAVAGKAEIETRAGRSPGST